MRLMKFGVGQPHTRVEDPPLLTGHGRYVTDAIPAGAHRAMVVRSPHAHARFKFTALATAGKMPGVRLILTAADIADFGPERSLAARCPQRSNESKVWVPPSPVLPRNTARYVGEPVAFVVADTVDEA